MVCYRSTAQPSERLSDVLYDEIIEEFTDPYLWQRFALSQYGLALTMGDLANIRADNPQNHRQQKMDTLELWRQKMEGVGKIIMNHLF